MYKESEKENLEKKISGERDLQIIEEREDMKKSMFDESFNIIDETNDNIIQDDDILDDDEGYYDQTNFNAEGDEHEDDLDAMQLHTD